MHKRPKLLTAAAMTLMFAASGCFPIESDVPIEVGQDQFKIVLCSIEQGRADMRTDLNLGLSIKDGPGTKSMLAKLEAAANDFTDPEVKWPRNVNRADLEIMAEQFLSDADSVRKLARGQEVPSDFGDVPNRVKFASSRIHDALELDDVYEGCDPIEFD